MFQRRAVKTGRIVGGIFHSSRLSSGAWRLLQQVAACALQQLSRSRAKYWQRMNGRIMAPSRTRESKNGFTPPVELAVVANAPISCRAFAFADPSKKKHDFSYIDGVAEWPRRWFARPACAGQNLCRCLQNYKQLIVKWINACRGTIGQSRTNCHAFYRTRGAKHAPEIFCSGNEENVKDRNYRVTSSLTRNARARGCMCVRVCV